MVPPCISFNIVLLFLSTAAGAIAATINWPEMKTYLTSCPVIGCVGGWMDKDRTFVLFQAVLICDFVN